MTNTAFDTSTIEELDFDVELPCEHSQHKKMHRPDEPASFLVAFNCSECDVYSEYLMCKPGVIWMVSGAAMYQCPYCDAIMPKSNKVFFVVRPI